MNRVQLIIGALAISAIPALGANLLTNGDFDTGSLAPWVAYNAGTWMGQPGVGDAAAGVFNPGGNTSDGFSLHASFGANMVGGNMGAYQQVSVTPGVPLTLEWDVAGGIGAMGNFNGVGWWEVRWMDQAWDAGQMDAGPLLWKKEVTADTKFGWSHVVAQFTPMSPVITVYTKNAGWDPQWDWMYFGAYYDSFTLVPEPSALAMLVLAALPMLRRRR